MNYTFDELKEILLDNDYPASNHELIASVVSQLQNLSAEAKHAFEHWYDTRELPTFDINGVTVDYMKTYHHATDIAIILAYDGLIKNPKSAYLLTRPIIKH